MCFESLLCARYCSTCENTAVNQVVVHHALMKIIVTCWGGHQKQMHEETRTFQILS